MSLGSISCYAEKVASGFISAKKMCLSVPTEIGTNIAKVPCHRQTLNYSVTLCFEGLTFHYFKRDLNRNEPKRDELKSLMSVDLHAFCV